jgi:hypothetical protein
VSCCIVRSVLFELFEGLHPNNKVNALPVMEQKKDKTVVKKAVYDLDCTTLSCVSNQPFITILIILLSSNVILVTTNLYTCHRNRKAASPYYL